ncbi:hypothetical protein QJS04_geneDACA011465 [Acorus gramineus]|uniref:Mannosyltransferase n=1 Tax=Acorus gramineus TaxID=55184 RepID=A0AAV9AMB2_ACOGR|nr:hypothetical protein QJS04_geneDACA011465 [Acorus gramineus]
MNRRPDAVPPPLVGDSVDGEKEEKIVRRGSPNISPFSGWSEKRVLALCLAFRATNAMFVQTYFNPDEHWQSLEVAHRIAFGYGHLTWEWKKGIRSYLHPLIFASLYKILAFFGLDITLIMVKAPRLLQSFFSAFGDLYLYKLSCLIFNESVAQWALFSQLANWFMFFCITRTLSNSLETVLTTMGLFYWLCSKDDSNRSISNSRKLALSIAALTCAIRPTSAITWLYIGLWDLFVKRERLKFIFLEVVPIGALVLSFTCLLDRWMYGSWIFVPLNFLRFNFLSSGGDYYGTHKWHWYFTQGFTVMLFTFLPFSVVGIYQSKEWKLSGLLAWVLGVYSLLGHKEFRFVLPVLPVALMFAGYSLATLSNHYSFDYQRKRLPCTCSRFPSRMSLIVSVLLLTNLPMALYMSLVHQRGSEDVMKFLASEAPDQKVKSILFLMPCHATPYYSTLHHNLSMRFMDCSPSDEDGYMDESDRFMMDPVGFTSNLLSNGQLPSHIVLFDTEEKQLKELLNSLSYKEIQRFFHAHFKVDRDLQSSIAVYSLEGL